MSRALSFVLLGLTLAACRSNDRDTEQSSSPQPADWEASDPYGTRSERETAKVDERDAQEAKKPWNDDDFVRKAVQGGQFEIESSRLADEKASSGDVKEFATMMIEDHGTANETLDGLVRSKRITLPKDMGTVHVEKLEALKELEGPQFDREYTMCQIKAHDEAIAMFERATREARDREIRDFAVKTLPTLRRHRSMLTDIEASLTKEDEKPIEPGG